MNAAFGRAEQGVFLQTRKQWMIDLRLSTATTIRAVLAVFLVALAGFSLRGAVDSYQAMRDADRSAHAARVLATLDKGTVEMSFERSLTQVGLALPDAFGPPFSELLADQRRKADENLELIGPMLAELPESSRAPFKNAFDRHRATVDALRREADAALGVAAVDRPAGAVVRVPAALKEAILLLRESGQLLAVPGAALPSEALALSALMDAGWRTREFGGRERTYIAIAALTGNPIAPEALAEARLNADIAAPNRNADSSGFSPFKAMPFPTR